MEILSAGAFINLENQEKIECLQFTAVELANAALTTEGFANTEESGTRLALEFWQGLEYMCRETEEAAIKNIFLNHFLNRLRNSRPAQPAETIDLPQESVESVSDPLVNEEKPEDEFLGIIDTAADDETSTEETVAVIEESLSRTEDFLTAENDSFEETEVKTTENGLVERVENKSLSTESTGEIEEKVESAPENTDGGKTAVGNLSLQEKEPYQFNKCTVTATIQLLPTVDGAISRKVVLSVRTHDFAPQISLVHLAGNNLTAELIPELEKVLAKYRSDLPAKVMDQLKREKTAGKKHAPKTTSEVKTVSQETAKPKESVKVQAVPTEANQTAAPVVPPAAQTGQQGSLFGF